VSDEYGADLVLAIDAARRAGDVVMKFFGSELNVTYKSDGQPLTDADLAADSLLHELLIGARPDYGWLSEETRDRPDRLERERVWIVDPIDGTRSFVAHRPEFTISIGLVEAGDPVVGVVFNPARNELFHAVRGGGAVLVREGSESQLHVRMRAGPAPAQLLASRSEGAAGEFDPFEGDWQIAPTGSTAYKLAGAAAGRGDGYVSRGAKSEWDVCAGVLLVREAGGRVTDLDGRELRFNRTDPYVHGIVAASDRVHDQLLKVVRDLPPSGRMRGRTSGATRKDER